MDGQLKIQNLTKKRAPFTIFSKIPAEKDQQKQFDYGSRNLRLQFTPNFENDQRTVLRPANDMHHPIKEEDEDKDNVISLKSCSGIGGSTNLSPNVSSAKQVRTNKDSEKHANSSPRQLHLRVDTTCNDDKEDCRIPALKLAKTNIKKTITSYLFVAKSEHKSHGQSCEDPQACTQHQTAKSNSTNTFHLDLKDTANQLLSSKQNLQKQVSSSPKLLRLSANQKLDGDHRRESQPTPTKEFHLKKDPKTLLKGNSASMHSSVANGNRARTTDANQKETDTQAPSLVCLQKGVKSSRRPLCLLVNPKLENDVDMRMQRSLERDVGKLCENVFDDGIEDPGASVSGEDKDVDGVIDDPGANICCENKDVDDVIDDPEASISCDDEDGDDDIDDPAASVSGDEKDVDDVIDDPEASVSGDDEDGDDDIDNPEASISGEDEDVDDIDDHEARVNCDDSPCPGQSSVANGNRTQTTSTNLIPKEAGNALLGSSGIGNLPTVRETTKSVLQRETSASNNPLNKDPSVQCMLCSDKFTCKADLARHLAVHLGKDPPLPPAPSESLEDECTMDSTNEDQLLAASTSTAVNEKRGFASDSSHINLSETGQEDRSVKVNLATCKDSDILACTGNSQCKCVLCGWMFGKRQESDAGQFNDGSDVPADDQLSTASSSTIIMDYDGSGGVKLHLGQPEDSRCTGDSACKCVLCGWAVKETFLCNICHEQFATEDNFVVHKATHSNCFLNQHIEQECDKNDVMKKSCKPDKYECIRPKRVKLECNKLEQSKNKLGKSEYSESDQSEQEDSESEQTETWQSEKRSKSHHCDNCQRTFKSERALINHHLRLKRYAASEKKKPWTETESVILKKSEHKSYECNICHLKIKKKYLFIQHIKIHNDCPFFHKCEFCGKGYNNKENFIQHVRLHTGERPFLCEVCGASFRGERSLTHHLKSHSPTRPWKCEVCEKRFKYRCHLYVHMKSLHEGKRYQCNVCNKTYSRQWSLTDHMRVHTGDKPHKCEQCGKTFGRPNLLAMHLSSHRGEAKYGPCEFCGKFLTTKYGLTCHRRKHTGEKPFQCDECGKCFAIKRTLVCHERTHRPKEDVSDSP